MRGQKNDALEMQIRDLRDQLATMSWKQQQYNKMLYILQFRADLAEEQRLTPEALQTITRQADLRATLRKKRRRKCPTAIERLAGKKESKMAGASKSPFAAMMPKVFVISAGEDKKSGTEDDMKLRLSE